MLISLDIAFKNIGWSVWEGKRPVAAGVIQTEKTQKKSTRVSDDNAHRCAVASRMIRDIVEKYNVKGVIGEMPTGSQSASAAKSAGLAIGVVATTAGFLGLPTEWCTPDAVKKAVCGRKDAGKEAIMDKISELYGGEKVCKTINVTKGKRAGKVSELLTYSFLGECWSGGAFEHIADSCGAYLALQDNNLVRIYG